MSCGALGWILHVVEKGGWAVAGAGCVFAGLDALGAQISPSLSVMVAKPLPWSCSPQVVLINAVKDVAKALGDLIGATKAAAGKAGDDPAVYQLKNSAKV